MKAFIFTFFIVSASMAQAELGVDASMGEKFCTKQAESYVQTFNQKHLKEIGPIQGYYEDVSFEYSQDILDMDNRLETYVFYISSSNDEEDYWTSKYVVVMDAWLSAGGVAHSCYLQSFVYEGIVEALMNE